MSRIQLEIADKALKNGLAPDVKELCVGSPKRPFKNKFAIK